MADRNPARLAAPLALLAAAVAVAVVAVVGASRSSAPSTSTPSVTRTAVTQPVRQARRDAPRAYVVKPGDTLSVIADKTDVSLDEIQRLNPDVDPNALQTGQRLKLSP